MNKKYHLSFEFFNTFEEAENFIKKYIEPLKTKNKYLYNKNKNIHAQNWSSSDGSESKKLLWYYY